MAKAGKTCFLHRPCISRQELAPWSRNMKMPKMLHVTRFSEAAMTGENYGTCFGELAQRNHKQGPRMAAAATTTTTTTTTRTTTTITTTTIQNISLQQRRDGYPRALHISETVIEGKAWCVGLRPWLPEYRLHVFGLGLRVVPLEQIEYGSGYVVIRSPYTPYSIYLRNPIP